MKTSVLLLASLVASGAASAALPAVGPNYQRPDAEAPLAWRDGTPAAVVLDAEWWRSFNDPALDARIRRALAANQDLRAALARVEQSRALTGAARADYLPTLAAGASTTREESSRTVENRLPDSTTTTYRVPLSLSWELDLFGRVRRLNEAARADFASAQATYAAARLALVAEVASTHFTLQALDREVKLLTDTLGWRRDAVNLVEARFRSGNAGELDVARAETELATTEAEVAALAVRRASVETGLGVLLGEAAPAFQAEATAVTLHEIPAIPAGLPSELLQRRPDIAAAERTLASANARIGVAKAAFFPAFSLTGTAGYASADIDDVFKRDSRFWSIGPSVYLPLFQGGRNRANLARSRARYEETLAQYQQQVLVAFREVQDALTASHWLANQAAAQARAVASARRGAELSQKRYDAGFVSYLEVVDAQRTALEVERAATRLTGQRLITHVALIKALGGGWQETALPQEPSL